MSSPRLRRLKLDSERLDARFAGWPAVSITRRIGTPPEAYEVTYNLKGLYVDAGGTILERNKHVMTISLSLAYPRRAPQCKMLTPVFHPNFDDASVCIGDFWAASEGLDDLIVRIGRMIGYQEYNIKSPLNGLAARWAAEHQTMFPVHLGEIAPPAPAADGDDSDKVVIRFKGEEEGPSVTFTEPVTETWQSAVLMDCHSGDHSAVDQFPYSVGGLETDNWHIVDEALHGSLFTLTATEGACWLTPAPGASLFLDGQPVTGETLVNPGEDHTLTGSSQYFLLRLAASPEAWLGMINPTRWHVFQPDTQAIAGPFDWPALLDHLRQAAGTSEDAVVYCEGLQKGFFASQFSASP